MNREKPRQHDIIRGLSATLTIYKLPNYIHQISRVKWAWAIAKSMRDTIPFLAVVSKLFKTFRHEPQTSFDGNTRSMIFWHFLKERKRIAEKSAIGMGRGWWWPLEAGHGLRHVLSTIIIGNLETCVLGAAGEDELS